MAPRCDSRNYDLVIIVKLTFVPLLTLSSTGWMISSFNQDYNFTQFKSLPKLDFFQGFLNWGLTLKTKSRFLCIVILFRILMIFFLQSDYICLQPFLVICVSSCFHLPFWPSPSSYFLLHFIVSASMPSLSALTSHSFPPFTPCNHNLLLLYCFIQILI